MKHTEANVTIELIQGNIVEQDDVEAVVNAANAQLRTGGGVAGVIHSAAGPDLAKETRPLAPIQPSEAVITGGHDLPNDHIIHVLGPVYGRDEPSDELLRAGYENALHRAEEHDVFSLAFPAISTGAFGFPVRPAARIALSTILDRAPDLESVTLIRLVLFGEDDFEVHKEVLSTLLEERDSRTPHLIFLVIWSRGSLWENLVPIRTGWRSVPEERNVIGRPHDQTIPEPSGARAAIRRALYPRRQSRNRSSERGGMELEARNLKDV